MGMRTHQCLDVSCGLNLNIHRMQILIRSCLLLHERLILSCRHAWGFHSFVVWMNFVLNKVLWWRSLLLVVCVSRVGFESTLIDDPSLFDFNPFEKYVFSKESEKSTCWNFDSTGCFTLSVFWKGFEKAWLWLTFLSSQFNRLFHVFNRIFFLKTLTKLC